MATVIKPSTNPQRAVVGQFQHVSRPSGTVAQTTTQNIFQVRGGRVMVRGLLGEVTTVIGSTTENIKVTSTAKNNAGTTVGTAVDVASNVDTNALEVGGKLWVEGDGTALVKSNAGAAFIGANSGCWVAPQGYINYETGASTTGAIKWDLWYQSLDEGAEVVAVPLTATGV